MRWTGKVETRRRFCSQNLPVDALYVSISTNPQPKLYSSTWAGSMGFLAPPYSILHLLHHPASCTKTPATMIETLTHTHRHTHTHTHAPNIQTPALRHIPTAKHCSAMLKEQHQDGMVLTLQIGTPLSSQVHT